MGKRHHPIVQEVERARALVAALLHRHALEELGRTAEEHEVTTDGEAEGPHAAALLEEVPEGIPIDAKVGLVEVARISCVLHSGTVHRHEADGVGDDNSVSLIRQTYRVVRACSEPECTQGLPATTAAALIDAY